MRGIIVQELHAHSGFQHTHLSRKFFTSKAAPSLLRKTLEEISVEKIEKLIESAKYGRLESIFSDPGIRDAFSKDCELTEGKNPIILTYHDLDDFEEALNRTRKTVSTQTFLKKFKENAETLGNPEKFATAYFDFLPPELEKMVKTGRDYEYGEDFDPMREYDNFDDQIQFLHEYQRDTTLTLKLLIIGRDYEYEQLSFKDKTLLWVRG